MDKKDFKKVREKEISYEMDLKTPLIKEAKVVYKIGEEIEYEKFLNLPEGERAEFIDGRIYYLAAPNKKHQELSMRLSLRFGNYLHGKSCKVYATPFAVKIDFDRDQLSKNTLLPDLLIICDGEKLDKQGVKGAPDLIIEILSPSNPSHDKVFKYNKYLVAGVKEYWIVDPDKEQVMVNLLQTGRYETRFYAKGDVIKPAILSDLYINVTDLFYDRESEEVMEVEVARQEEREKAEIIREEVKQKAEVNKMAIANSLLRTGMDIEEIEKHTGYRLK